MKVRLVSFSGLLSVQIQSNPSLIRLLPVCCRREKVLEHARQICVCLYVCAYKFGVTVETYRHFKTLYV